MSNIIVMAFSPRNIVGCLLKESLQRGVTGTPGPPSYALDPMCNVMTVLYTVLTTSHFPSFLQISRTNFSF